MSESESCIDKIERWLKYMGIDTIKRNSNSKLEVKLRTSNYFGIKYTLHFYFPQDKLLIESFVFKGVSGRPEKVELFQNILLGYNGAVSIQRIAFAYIPLLNKEHGVVLQTSQNCSSLTINELKNILDNYNIAYTTHVPRLMELINELELKVDGKGPDLQTILRNILER